jgi:hypothetical protein
MHQVDLVHTTMPKTITAAKLSKKLRKQLKKGTSGCPSFFPILLNLPKLLLC